MISGILALPWNEANHKLFIEQLHRRRAQQLHRRRTQQSTASSALDDALSKMTAFYAKEATIPVRDLLSPTPRVVGPVGPQALADMMHFCLRTGGAPCCATILQRVRDNPRLWTSEHLSQTLMPLVPTLCGIAAAHSAHAVRKPFVAAARTIVSLWAVKVPRWQDGQSVGLDVLKNLNGLDAKSILGTEYRWLQGRDMQPVRTAVRDERSPSPVFATKVESFVTHREAYTPVIGRAPAPPQATTTMQRRTRTHNPVADISRVPPAKRQRV